MAKHKFNKDVYFGIFASVFVGAGTIFLSKVSKLLNPIIITVFASLFSIVFLVLLSYLFKEKLEFKKLFKYKKELLIIVLGRGIIGAILIAIGFSLTSAIHGLFLLRTEPIFVTLFAFLFFKEKITLKQILLIFTMLLGAFLLITSFNLNAFQSYYLGDLLIILSMAILASVYPATAKIMKHTDSTTLTIATNFLSGLILLPFIFFIPFNMTLESGILLGAYTLLFFVFGLYFFFKALRSVKPWIVSSLMALELFIGILLALVWIGDKLTWIQWIGGIIILIGAYFITKEAK